MGDDFPFISQGDGGPIKHIDFAARYNWAFEVVLYKLITGTKLGMEILKMFKHCKDTEVR